MSRSKTVYIAIIFNFIFQLVNFSYKFLVTPFLLGAWGDIRYGEWLVLFSFISSVSLLNFGIAKFYGNNLRKLYLNSKTEEYKTLLSEAIILAFMIFILIGISLYFLIDTVNLVAILNINEWPREDVNLAIWFLGLSIAGSIFLEIISYLYVSVGKYSVQPILSSLNLLVQLVLIIILSYFGAGIITMSLIILGSVLTITAIALITFVMKFPDLIPNRIHFNIGDIKSSISTSSYFQLITFSQFFVLQGSVLLISNHLGAAIVSLFVITRTITSGLGRQVIQIINHSVWPELTSLFAEKNYTRLRLLHNILSKISIILTTFFILFTLLFIDDIFNIWLSTDKYLDYTLIGLLLGYLIVLYTWIPSSFILMANNDVKALGILSIISSMSFLLFSYFFLPKIEIYGVIFIMIIVDLFFMTYKIPQIACDKIFSNKLNFFIQMFKLFIPSIIILLIFFIYFIDQIKTFDFIFKLFIAITISMTLIIYFIKFTMTTYEKKYLQDKFRKIYMKVRK